MKLRMQVAELGMENLRSKKKVDYLNFIHSSFLATSDTWYVPAHLIVGGTTSVCEMDPDRAPFTNKTLTSYVVRAYKLTACPTHLDSRQLILHRLLQRGLEPVRLVL